MLKFKNLSKFSAVEHRLLTRQDPEFFTNPEVVLGAQVHQNKCAWVDSRTTSPIPEVDALITKEKGIWLGIKTADCVPVLMYDPQKQIIAAVHAGWRGTVYRLVQETLDQMKCFTDRLVVGLGPAICPQHFVVGPEIAKYFSPEVKEEIESGAWQVDLWQANKLQLLERGVLEKNIEILDLCTYEQKDLFYSYRRGDLTGRQGSFIKLN